MPLKRNRGRSRSLPLPYEPPPPFDPPQRPTPALRSHFSSPHCPPPSHLFSEDVEPEPRAGQGHHKTSHITHVTDILSLDEGEKHEVVLLTLILVHRRDFGGHAQPCGVNTRRKQYAAVYRHSTCARGGGGQIDSERTKTQGRQRGGKGEGGREGGREGAREGDRQTVRGSVRHTQLELCKACAQLYNARRGRRLRPHLSKGGRERQSGARVSYRYPLVW